MGHAKDGGSKVLGNVTTQKSSSNLASLLLALFNDAVYHYDRHGEVLSAFTCHKDNVSRPRSSYFRTKIWQKREAPHPQVQ